jgi:redox-sensitive bicupin YhaK (pirin superfamily)
MRTRRQFLLDSTVAAAALAASCRMPAFLRTSVRAVLQTLPGVPHVDGAGVQLTRVFPQPALANLDPFVLVDRLHSNHREDFIRGFPDHPHRGFETVTVMLEGQVRHRDSRGNHGLIRGGGAQWMTAGRGIVHSEMPEQDSGWLSGFQLWINLPAKEKMCPQEYQDLAPARIAEEKLSPAGSLLRVIAGSADGLAGPVRDRATKPVLLTIALEDDRPFELALPEDHVAFAFVHDGVAGIGPADRPTQVPEGTLAILGPGSRVRMRATDQRSGVLFAAAKPLREPIAMRGPFVMNTEAELHQAFEDYRNGVLDRA